MTFSLGLRFVLVLFVFICMFAHVFFLRLGQVKQEDYGFHDPDQSAPFQSVAATFQNLYALGFLGDYDNDAFPDPADIFFADLFVFGVIVVLLNVLIAIVNESYAKAMGQKEELFWRARLQLVTQAEDVAGWVFRSNFFPSDLLGADYTARLTKGPGKTCEKSSCKNPISLLVW